MGEDWKDGDLEMPKTHIHREEKKRCHRGEKERWHRIRGEGDIHSQKIGKSNRVWGERGNKLSQGTEKCWQMEKKENILSQEIEDSTTEEGEKEGGIMWVLNFEVDILLIGRLHQKTKNCDLYKP